MKITHEYLWVDGVYYRHPIDDTEDQYWEYWSGEAWTPVSMKNWLVSAHRSA